MGLLDYLRAAGSGLLGGAVGWPMDTAVNLGNLAKAGYGYGGRTLGMLGTEDLPEITDPATVPGTSAYISKLLGVGDSAGEQVAEFAAGLLAPGPKAKPPKTLKAIVYHGSPHKFDKFDASKIGTGEGAQAYGHGLYLAEAPDVAKYYQQTGINATPSVRKNGVRVESELLSSERPGDNVFMAQVNADTPRGRTLTEKDLHKVKDSLRHLSDYYAGSPRASYYEDALNRFEELKAKVIGGRFDYEAGSLYKVDLPDEWLPKMLDWDKPFSQQPEAVKKVINDQWAPRLKTREIGPDLVDVYATTGGSLGAFPRAKVADVLRNPADYLPFKGEQLVRGADSHARELASDDLLKAGIPGIRYLDQGSRGSGQGTSNYVVFPGMEHLLKILSRE